MKQRITFGLFWIILLISFVCAAPVCTLISRTPADINDTSSGILTVLLNCSDAAGINVSKSGNHYSAFATRTLDSFEVAPGVPNRWSIRPPVNNLAQIDPNLSAYGQIFRAMGRGESYWYESLNTSNLTGDNNLSSWLLYDNYSYAVDDGEYGAFKITTESATNAIINYTSKSVRVTAFKQNIPLSYESLVKEVKKNLTINKNLQALVLINDLEVMKGNQNYTSTLFRNIGLTSTAPTAVLRVFYCNSSYSPTGGINILLSPNCIYINAISPSSLNTIVLTDRNSSYSQGFYSIINRKIGNIIATPVAYMYYDTLESNPGRGYNYRYANGTTNTNVSFNQTGRTWTSTNSGSSWTQFNATLDLIGFSTKESNDEFIFGYCVYNLAGVLGCNSSVFVDQITATNHPITPPNIIDYNSSAAINDFNLNSTHKGILNIRVGCAKDPDSVGNVTHNLTLRNIDGSFNYTINGSFTCTGDAVTWINFNTSKVSDGVYRMNLTAKSGDNALDIKTYLTYNNFTIDNTPPSCVLVSRTPADLNDSSTGIFNVLINCTDSNGLNVSLSGNHYWAFVTRTLDSFIIATGIPNYWSDRYPNNSLGVTGVLTPPYKIWKAQDRNEGRWYENLTGLSDCTGFSPCYQILNDTFSYSIEDGAYGRLNITNTSTSALINYTHFVDLATFRQSVYITYENMTLQAKYNYTIKKDNYILIKRFDSQTYRGIQNYTVNFLKNFAVTDGPSKSLRAFYCNISYSPTGSTPPGSSANCVLGNAIYKADLETIVIAEKNSSYSKSAYAVTNGQFGGIKTTAEYYLGYTSEESGAGKSYEFRYANGTNKADVAFNDSKIAWTTSDGGVTWVQANFTPDIFSTNTRKENDEFQFGIYISDLAGNVYKNFTFISDPIAPTNHPITSPLILNYYCPTLGNDTNLNGTHTGIMTIHVSVAKDPDGIGTVAHNLTLRNVDGTFNYTINGSFYSADDGDVWINFNTNKVPTGVYRMDISARADDNLLNIKNSTTDANFSIISFPVINLISPADEATWTSSSTVDFNFNVTDGNPISSCSLILNNIVEQTDPTITRDTTLIFSKLLSNGMYNWSINCTDSRSNVSNSSTYQLAVNYNPSSSSSSSGGSSSSSSGGSIYTGYIIEQNKGFEGIELSAIILSSVIKTISNERQTGITEIEISVLNKTNGTLFIAPSDNLPDYCDINYSGNYSFYKALNITSTFNSASINQFRIRLGISNSWIVENNISEIKAVKCYPYYKELIINPFKEKDNLQLYDIYSNSFSTLAIIGIEKNGTTPETEKISSPLISYKSDSLYFLIIIVLVLIIAFLVYNKLRKDEAERRENEQERKNRLELERKRKELKLKTEEIENKNRLIRYLFSGKSKS
jgi:hypothetical protein